MITGKNTHVDADGWKALHLLPSDQEEVDSCQADAELLAEAQQKVPDGHAGPQRHGAARAVRQADVTLPQGGAAASALCRHQYGTAGNVTLRTSRNKTADFTNDLLNGRMQRNVPTSFLPEPDVPSSRLAPDDRDPWDSRRPLLPEKSEKQSSYEIFTLSVVSS